MAFTDSHIFRAWVQQIMFKQGTPTTGTGEIVTNDAVKAALYGNTPIPDRNVAVASSGYNTAQWVNTSEISTGSEWVATGRVLAGKSCDVGTANIVAFKASNLTGTVSVTLTAVFGCLVYDDTITAGTVADEGICYNFFGGSQSVTAGTFSVNWNASGIFNITI